MLIAQSCCSADIIELAWKDFIMELPCLIMCALLVIPLTALIIKLPSIITANKTNPNSNSKPSNDTSQEAFIQSLKIEAELNKLKFRNQCELMEEKRKLWEEHVQRLRDFYEKREKKGLFSRLLH